MTTLAEAAEADWTKGPTFWVALSAAVIAVAALGVSIWAAWSARRSAKAAEETVTVEKDREHRTLEPTLSDVTFRLSERGAGGQRTLFLSFVPNRDYRIRGQARKGNGHHDVVNELPAHGGRRVEAAIETWSPDRKESAWEYVHLRFWPPNADVDDVKPWTCRCGAEVLDGSGDESGHWEARIDIRDVERPVEPRVRWM